MASTDSIKKLTRSLSETELGGAHCLDPNTTSDFISERGIGSSRRTRTLTEKGQQFVESLKENNLKQAVKKLERRVNDLELLWLDRDSETLRNERHELEKCRKTLEISKNEFEKVASITESQRHFIQICEEQNKQALDLRKKIGERIFELEREEMRSRRSKSVTTSRRTDKSIQRMKALNLKYARLEADFELELQRKKFEFEELQIKKNYEIAKAEADMMNQIEQNSVLSLEEDLKELEIQSKEERVRNYISSLPPDLPQTGGQHNSVNHELGNGNAQTGSQHNDPQRDNANAQTGSQHNDHQRDSANAQTGSQHNDHERNNRNVQTIDNISTCATGIPSVNSDDPDNVFNSSLAQVNNVNMYNSGNPMDNVLDTRAPLQQIRQELGPASQVYQHPYYPTCYAVKGFEYVPEQQTSVPPVKFIQPPALSSTPQAAPNSQVPMTQPGQPKEFSTPYQMSNPSYFHQYSIPTYQSSAQDIGLAIAEGMEAARLPTPTLDVFSGNPLEWPTWKAAFEAVIEKRATNTREKILYLQQYLSGEPKKIVEGYQFVQTPEAYQEAKKTLERRFGHPSVVAEAFRNKLENWPRIAPRDGKALREFADFLKTCELAMQSVEDLETLNKQHDNKQLLKILPSWMHSKWGTRVRDFQLRHGDAKFPPFKEFVHFVACTADVQCLPVLAGLDAGKLQRGDAKGRTRNGYHRSGASSLSTGVTERSSSREQKASECLWCKAHHHLNACHEFCKRTIKERVRFVIRKGLCLRCLQHGHMSKENKCRDTVNCTKCKQQHPTCLHIDSEDRNKPQQKDESGNRTETAASKCTSVCKLEGQQLGQDQSLVVPVWVSNTENPQVEKLTYALIDCQSNATFITESLRSTLKIEGVNSHLLLSTMHQENEVIECKRIQGLTVQDYKRQVSITLPKTFTRPAIPCKPSQIPKPEVAKQWKHLNRIADELMTYRDDIEVGLLIGTNCPKAIKPREVIPGSDDDPYGIRTDLGWGIVGRVCKSPPNEELPKEFNVSWSNRTTTDKVLPDIPEVHNEHNDAHQAATFTTETRAREVISPAQVREMFERDFHEKSNPKQQSLSVDDRRFLKKLSNEIHKREDGHYEMPLPLKSEEMHLPYNRSQALRRLAQLKARLKRDARFQRDYIEFMGKTIKECAEKIPQDAKQVEGRVNYVAHHGVYHPKKPDKIRVVFDCSAVYKGTSLNKNLLQGPDLTNNLQGVLCRFREEPVAITCDVEGMFHQFYVNETDRDLLRFFWWEDGNLDSEPSEYRMKVHLFGAASSPGCANFGFKQAANDGEEEFGSEAASFIRQDFYVDDGVKSVATPEKAVEVIKNCQAICAKAGLRLHKISSNSKEVIQSIPAEDRAKSLQEINFNQDPLPIERTLGVMWCIESDCFQFKIAVQDRPLTRRGILSTVCSVFDPLGFLAPVVLVGKQILQELCREAIDWDEPISDHLRPKWERWRNELSALESIKITRCYKPENFGEIKYVEIHNFADASQSGYGQCSYLRLVNQQDQVHCTLLMGKARVTPLKPVTIPRLELTAAVVSVKVSQWLCQELEYQDITEIFWTDSQVVLGYINNSARRFHIYVANRVQQIHEHSEPKQWQYVSTESNPADAASRGLMSKELIESRTWFRGPEFLWKPGRYDIHQQKTPELSPEDPEVKRAATLTTQTAECQPARFDTCRFDRFSDWFTAKKAIANCLRFKRLLRGRITKKGSNAGDGKESTHHDPVTLEELRQAEIAILRSVQHEHFKEEIHMLSSLDVKGEFLSRDATKLRNPTLRKCSNLYRLDPYIDDEGLLRVGGRLRRANMDEKLKHPVILPRQAHITQIIVRHYHLSTKHQGRGITFNEVRQHGFWVIGGSSLVATIIARCSVCKKLRAPLQQQKMSDLPKDRLEPAPPFTYCGVDYFGPFSIKEGRKEVKRYGVLFTCMASRAIHLETAVSLSTDSFINALRRFLAERGPVRQIRSDCGTNFVGARNELKEALDEKKVRDMLLKENCEWTTFKMNPPSASHAGGVWERQIRSVRNALQPLMLEAGCQLDDESFRTLMKEVQAIVNSRPLATMNSDNLEPLTPNHLLTMKSKVLLPPPGVFLKADIYCRKRWRRVQHLTNEFWKKWRREYLQTLQMRKKWVSPTRNVKVNDVVIIKDDNLPRNDWKLARVDEVYPSDDGLVRKVRLAVATSQLDSKGKRLAEPKYLDRPIQKLVVLQHAE